MKLPFLSLIIALLTLGPLALDATAQGALRSGDSIEIRISGVPQEEINQFNNVYTVDGEGLVNIPYVGLVKAAGLQTSALQKSIENRLKGEKIFTHPTILISAQAQARFVNVGGNVRNPQRVVYTADLTLLGAISAAGGFNDFADAKRIRLIRDGKSAVFNIQKIKNDPKTDPTLKPGDQIDVPAAGLWPF